MNDTDKLEHVTYRNTYKAGPGLEGLLPSAFFIHKSCQNVGKYNPHHDCLTVNCTIVKSKIYNLNRWVNYSCGNV